MGNPVVMGAMCKCTFGLNVLPSGVMIENKPAAVFADSVPMMNILPFGMCMSPSNPQVAAALGSPMPCVPVIAGKWVPPHPKVFIKNKPILTKDAICMCNWGGVIQINNPGTTKVKC